MVGHMGENGKVLFVALAVWSRYMETQSRAFSNTSVKGFMLFSCGIESGALCTLGKCQPELQTECLLRNARGLERWLSG